VIEDTTDGKRDVVLLSVFFINAVHPEYMKNIEQSLLWPEDIQSSEKSVEIAFEIEESLLDEINEYCVEQGITIEQLILAFVRFSTLKDNYPALKEFIDYCKIKAELDDIKEDLQKLREEIIDNKKCLMEEYKMRKLASVQEISGIKQIEGADAIELVLIKGWQCVAKKGGFQKGDYCVYFEVDSFLPIDDRYEFLRKTSYRNNDFMGEGFRVKTITMRGELSQGLALPLSSFANIPSTPELDVTEVLGVRKWEQPESVSSAGIEIGEKPFSIPTTDETRLQSMPEFIEAFSSLPYYMTTKMDGTSCTIYYKDGKVGVCGRNKEYKEDVSTCSMWAWVYENDIINKLSKLNENIAIQGEFCGAGIQKNRLKLMKPNLFVFDILALLDGGGVKKVGLLELKQYCEQLRLDTVPIEEVGDSFNYTLDELLERARGKYASGLDKEGIVVRTQEFRHNYDINHKMSFKVINNDFLKKEKD